MAQDFFFTVTHPFHPLTDRSFQLLAQRYAWSEWQVFFEDPTTTRVRFLPMAWTDLAAPDPFVLGARGRAILRLVDVQAVVHLLDDQRDRHQQEPE